jgi:hypothetical protein
MSAVTIFQRARSTFDVTARGHHVVYRTGESNRCPGCGRQQWYVGRASAECGFCGTAVPLAEAPWIGGDGKANELRSTFRRAAPAEAAIEAAEGINRRRHERVDAAGRTLQLLIDGAPHAFALHNISASGLMGDDPVGLAPHSTVHVRFEGGILVPAEVRWTEGALTGLAFSAPVLLDISRQD